MLKSEFFGHQAIMVIDACVILVGFARDIGSIGPFGSQRIQNTDGYFPRHAVLDRIAG